MQIGSHPPRSHPPRVTPPKRPENPTVAQFPLPGPSSAQHQYPLNSNVGLRKFPSAMIQARPGRNTAAQIPSRPINAPHLPQQQQQINLETFESFSPGFSNPNAASNPLSPEKSSHLVFCRWCDRCKSGIPYSKYSYICLECKYWLCHGCRNVHTTLHKQRIKVEMRRWMEVSSEYAPASTCSQCSTVQMARLQCTSNNCSQDLCVACFHVNTHLDKFLKDHIEKEPMHQKLLAIYPNEWSVTETWRRITELSRSVTDTSRKSPCVCYEEETVARRPAWSTHCEKCHDPIDIGSSIYWCRECRQTWGFGQWICETCFLETDEDNMQHKQRHYFIKAIICEDSSLPDTHKERFYCPMCNQWLKETHYASHKHDTGRDSSAMSIHRNPDLYFMVSPRQKDWQRLNMYRSCDKELIAKHSYQYFDEVVGLSKCMMCQFLLAYNQSATICLKGNCNHWIYCASCTNNKRVDHRHKDSTYAVKVIRKMNLPVGPQSPVRCAKCLKSWFKTHFVGLLCNNCKYFAICWKCIGAASKGPSFEQISGLPHQIAVGSSHTCTASDWLLIFEPAQGIIRA